MQSFKRQSRSLADSISFHGKWTGHSISKGIIRVGTSPYYRLYEFNGVRIIERAAVLASQPEKLPNLLRMLAGWRDRKLAELQFISVACAVITGAVISSIQWQAAATAYWLALAFWYSALVLSVLGLVLAAQQMAILNFLGDVPTNMQSEKAQLIASRYLPLMIYEKRAAVQSSSPNRTSIDLSGRTFLPSWRMVFIWQCPIMFMAYSVFLFFFGLTLLVVTPLIRYRSQGWNSNSNVAVFYLVIITVALVCFWYCSYWAYHYVDMDLDATDGSEDQEDGTGITLERTDTKESKNIGSTSSERTQEYMKQMNPFSHSYMK